MSAAHFFESERADFFRPLHSSRRELIAACLRALYDRLHGPAADYAHNLNRESVKELLLPVIREYQDRVQADLEPDEFMQPEANDPQQLAALVVRVLLRDGWLEAFPDRQGLVTAFRLTRPGKLFAEAFWTLQRPSRSRQRNMRACRNSLESAMRQGDAHDIVDAYEHAEKVIGDLTEGIDLMQERIRTLMREATLHDQWDEFVEFLDRFQREYAKQLTVDSATLNRNAIRSRIEDLRVQLPDSKRERMEAQLQDIAKWAVQECSGPSVMDWLLDRIEEIVDAAHESKQPGFVRAMDTYIKRVTGLVQQSMMLRSGEHRHAYLAAVRRVASMDRAAQDHLLGRIGEQLAAAEVRLLDPSSFKLRNARQRRLASTVSVPPRASREALLAAAMRKAEAVAFAVSNAQLVDDVRKKLRLFNHPVRLSMLPLHSAQDVLAAVQTVEAARTKNADDLIVRRMPGRMENDFFTHTDYEINFKSAE